MVAGLAYFIPEGFADKEDWSIEPEFAPQPQEHLSRRDRQRQQQETRKNEVPQEERPPPLKVPHPHSLIGRRATPPEQRQPDGRQELSREWMYSAQLVLDETSYVARLQRVKLFAKREDYLASVQQHQAEVKITGEDRFNLFVYLVRQGFVWRLKKFQLRFFELIMQTMAENIVGATWGTEGERLMRKHGWRSSPKVCAASAPRRFGKTVTLAVVMCAYVLVMAGKIQSVFSTGSRASGGLRDLVRKTLEESGMRDMLMTRGTASETVLVRSIYAHGPQFSTMNFYPSDEKVGNSLFFFSRALARRI